MDTSQNLLVKKLAAAREKVRIGGGYCHYKHPEQAYKVLDLAITEVNERFVLFMNHSTAKNRFRSATRKLAGSK